MFRHEGSNGVMLLLRVARMVVRKTEKLRGTDFSPFLLQQRSERRLSITNLSLDLID